MICEKTTAVLRLPERYDAQIHCPVEHAQQWIAGAMRASCGKCVLCREGTVQIHRVLTDISTARGQDEDVQLLIELLAILRTSAGCEMTATAAEKCLELVQGDPSQWEQHISRKRCPNLVCSAYYTLHVLPQSCTGCGSCAAACPVGAIEGGEGLIHVIDNNACNRCLQCVAACPAGAVAKAGAVKPKGPAEPVPVGSFEEESGGRRRRRRGS